MSAGPRVVVHENAGAFLGRAAAWLEEREAENNLILGLSASLAAAPPVAGADAPFWATVEDDGGVVGCVLRTPPHKLILTRMPVAAATAVVEAAAARFKEIPAVLGPEDVAEAVARKWSALRGVRWRRGRPQRIYRLDAVIPPEGVPGTLRVAEEADLDVVHRWGEGFADELGAEFGTTPERRAAFVRDGVLFLWEHEGPCTMTVTVGATAHGIRVGYVYTPGERRGRGYASACVAAVSQKMLDAGRAFCVLYTDLTNPTSNAIYQRIGYRPVLDVVDMDFGEPESA